MNEELSELCRLCMGSTSTGPFQSVFSVRSGTLLSQLVMSFADIVVRKGDGLPKFICKPCLEELDQSLKFKWRIEESDSKLRKLDLQVETDFNMKSFKVSKAKDLNREIPLHTNAPSIFESMLGRAKMPVVIALEEADASQFAINDFNSSDTASDERIHFMCRETTNVSPCFTASGANVVSTRINRLSKTCTRKTQRTLPKFRRLEEIVSSNSAVTTGNGVPPDKNTQIIADKIKEFEQKLRCDNCHAKFTDRDQLIAHKKVCSGSRSGPCYSCGVFLESFTVAAKHFRSEHPTLPAFLCKICGKGTKSLVRFREHVDSHSTNRQKIVCEQCGKVMHTRSALSVHKEIKHNAPNQCFTCDVCQKRLYSKRYLRCHMRVHFKVISSHQCSYCRRKCSSKYYLGIHEMLHTGEKPFKCDFCEDGFRLNSLLRKHVLKSHYDLINVFSSEGLE